MIFLAILYGAVPATPTIVNRLQKIFISYYYKLTFSRIGVEAFELRNEEKCRKQFYAFNVFGQLARKA